MRIRTFSLLSDSDGGTGCIKERSVRSDYDVVLLKAFFAVNDMYLPLSPTAVLKLVADDKLQFQIRDRVEGFSEWKENELKKLSA